MLAMAVLSMPIAIGSSLGERLIGGTPLGAPSATATRRPPTTPVASNRAR
jgi:hypothetical protein